MKSSRLTLKTKLSVAFGLLSVAVMIVSGMALQSLNEANDNFYSFVDGINARAEMAESVRVAIDDRALAVRNLILVTTPADVAIEKAAVLDAEERVENRLEKFNAMVTGAHDMSDQARRLAAEITRIETLYRPIALDINRLALSNQRDAAIDEINTKCRPLLASLIKASNNYGDFTHQRAIKMIRDAKENFSRQRALLIAICFASIAMAISGGVAITRSLSLALGAEPAELAFVTQRVAAGDLSPIRGVKSAPPGSVLASMGEMQLSLVNLMSRIRSAADSIVTGSSQIATGNADLSSRTEQQAASLQETASSMEELTSTVKQNAENAQQASTLSTDASAITVKGSRVVSRVVDTMSHISSNSAKIADITGIIEGIAFQTNILALNAAVEAARAGEQGRGFAVVASEVRSLAQRSSSAAKEIKELISTSVLKVSEGATLASEAGATMSEVTRAIARVTDIMGEIAAASTEQSKGIEQVNHAIIQMDSVTQQNAALVEEAAAAANSLEGQGQQLTQCIAVFRFEPTTTK